MLLYFGRGCEIALVFFPFEEGREGGCGHPDDTHWVFCPHLGLCMFGFLLSQIYYLLCQN